MESRAGSQIVQQRRPAHAGRFLPRRKARTFDGPDLLQPEEEYRLSVELNAARAEITDLLKKLPNPWRRRVLGAEETASTREVRWPLRRIESCYARLLRFAAEPGAGPPGDRVREIERVKRRIDSARDSLVAGNLRLVAAMARRVGESGVPLVDLIQEGNLGLLEAIERFEPERGHRLATYAVWWIRRSLYIACREYPRIVRLPENITASLGRLRKASLELERALGRTPTAHEVAEELETSDKEVEQLQKLTHDARPLDAIHEGEGGGPGAVTPDLGTPSPLDSIMQRQLKDDVAEALELLSPRDRQIVRLRFGIGHERRHTLEQIARMFDLSREGIRLIERRALKALQSARGFLIEHLMRRTDRPLAAVRSVDD